MTNPFEGAPARGERQRRLRELDPLLRNEPIEELEIASEDELLKLFDGQAFVINRSTALIRAVEPIAMKLFIPVDPFAVKAKDAVRRLRPELDGTQIPFDLYKDMLDKLEKQARGVKFEVVGDLTGDPLIDHYKLTKNIRSGGGGLSSWDEFIMNMEPWLLWFTLNQLLGQFQCQEHQEACAAKVPQGSEVGPIQLRMAISIAAMMLILGMQEEHILFALRQPKYDVQTPPADIMNKARRLIESDGLHRELKEIVGAMDPYLVIQHCNNYITKHPTGYEEWVAYRDLRSLRRDLSISYVYAHQYSPGHRDLIDVSINSVHRTPSNSGSSFPNPLGVSRGTRVVHPESISGMSKTQLDAISQQLSLADRNVSAIAGVLTSGFGLDILCCFARFLVRGGDVSRLKRIKALVLIGNGIAINGIDLDQATMESLMDWVYAQLQQEIMSRVQRALDHQALDISDWFYNMDPDLVEDLAYCPFILDLIMMVNQSIQQLRNKLFEIIREFLGRIETLNTGTLVRWGTMYDIRRNNVILSILNATIENLEACAGTDSSGGEGVVPDPGEDETFYSGVPKPLKLPPEVVQKFFRNPDPVTRPDGRPSIPAVGTTISSTQEISVTRENYRQFCLGILPDQVLDAVFPEDS